ncbi:hypothetical protein LTR37_008012 [Vermiconidia calcicola]|uniref:Uncharacterized protein n=1 Tax=Vermiconidia calcicola TaxID=1690605 RepID=A0ACC3NEW6_9PEZI|nr:hypothetical protein LTR37_008012 [Vermiconidia calcicola]
MPIFYRINQFVLPCLAQLDDFLSKVAPRSRKHVRHISVTYCIDGTGGCGDEFQDGCDASAAFTSLAKLEGLEKLDLRIQENKWFARGASTMYASISTLPGLAQLGLVRGLKEVNFCGPCPNVERLVRADMLKPKIGTTIAGWKKRKAGAVDDQLTKGAKAKKAKVT